jgi:hypothetical protein
MMLTLAAAATIHLQVNGMALGRLGNLAGVPAEQRLVEVRKRLRAAISKDDTIQPHPATSWTLVGGVPVLRIGAVPIVSLTAADVPNGGTDRLTAARTWSARLDQALASLKPGDPVPGDLLLALRVADKAEAIALDAPIPALEPRMIKLRDGRFEATIAGGVVTLRGKATTLGEKLAIEAELSQVQGIADIRNLIEVEATTQVSDATLADVLTQPAN